MFHFPNNQEKFSFVNKIFSEVANKYDLMNDLMSLGMHSQWKKKLINKIENYNSNIIDVACGSGDLSISMHKNAIKKGIIPNITAADINSDMLLKAKAKAIDNNICSGIKFLHADAKKLPYEDNTFDYYTISFGIRNVDDIPTALTEAYRVLKPNGKFLCLEFSMIQDPIIKDAYSFYLDKIIPLLGKYIADNKAAYQYLSQSIKNFPKPLEFSNMISEAGFSNSIYENMNFNTVNLYIAYK